MQVTVVSVNIVPIQVDVVMLVVNITIVFLWINTIQVISVKLVCAITI